MGTVRKIVLCAVLSGAFLGISPRSASASDVQFLGSGNYVIWGSVVTLNAAGIQNYDLFGHSGTLRLELWAYNYQFQFPSVVTQLGFRLAKYQLGPLNAGWYYSYVEGTVDYTPPPVGNWIYVLALSEYTGAPGNDGFSISDFIQFPQLVPIGTPTPRGSIYSRDYIQKAYIAYYGRPADPAGLEYWATRMDAEGQSLASVINAFGNSQEFRSRYGGLGNAELVATVYRQALAREPDPVGLAWYVNELNAGRRTLQSITLDVLNGATAGMDAATVQYKLFVAALYTGKVAGGCPYGTPQQAASLLATVNSTFASANNAQLAIRSNCGF